MSTNDPKVVPISRAVHRDFAPIDTNQPDDTGRLRIEQLRYFAGLYALTSAGDWDRACRVIAVVRKASLKAYALALIGTLDIYAKQPINFYQRGSKSLSAGEIWLARLLEAIAQGDSANVHALLSFCLKGVGHRRAIYMASGVLSELEMHSSIFNP